MSERIVVKRVYEPKRVKEHNEWLGNISARVTAFG